MKKLLSLLLAIALLAGLCTALCGLPVCAEADYTAELWNPVEICLTSTVNYKNAYLDADLDATFTHEDGTIISLPGFWDGGQNWCVRFSPTKTGTWTFSTVCSNKDDTGLFSSGTVKAVPSTGTTDTAKHGFVRVSDDKRHYVYDDGTPFFWLGDTNWQAPECVAWDENNYPYSESDSMLKVEVDNRVSKGFTVYQTYFTCTGSQQGMPNYWVTTGRKVKTEVFRNRLDKMFEYIHNSGMVIALGFGLGSTTPNAMKQEYHQRFIRYCIARYACYNVVWISGQEITTDAASLAEGKTCMQVWMEAQELTDRLDGYHHPQTSHMTTIPFSHTCSMRLYNAAWHDAWLLQGGHASIIQPMSFYKGYYVLPNVKPIVEGEANYEEINCGGFIATDAPRYSAWKSILCGCTGFTYGVSGIWASCYSTTGRVGWFDGKGGSFSYEPWYMTLDKPGSFEVSYMKRFFEALPDWTKLVPRFDNMKYADFAQSEKKLLASTEDGKTAVCYFFNDDTSTGTVMNLAAGQTYTALWYNPLTGHFLPTSVTVDGTTAVLPEKPDTRDWALVVTCEPMSRAYITEKPFEDLSARGSAVTGSPVTPQKVTAIGGLSYNAKQELTDHTAYLSDNDVSTVWRPFISRVTQTILYDLGTPHKLTHIVMQPTETTLLPRYRVEGSNDGKDWTILVNTTVREPLMNGINVSEPLAGTYRYVKVLFLTAENFSNINALDQNYEILHTVDWAKANRYSYEMALAELTVYSDGAFTPEPTEAPVTPVPDNGQTNTPGSDGEATPDTTEPVAAKNNRVLPIILIAGAVLVIAVCALLLILKPRKKS